MSALITQSSVEVLIAGSPKARITQAGIEVIMIGNQIARITQESVEVVVVFKRGRGFATVIG